MPLKALFPSSVTLILALALLAGCGKPQSPAGVPGGQMAAARHIVSPRQIKKSEMSAAEQRYGIAPVPDASVEYQPDVIVVGGGAESVRAQDPNGFMWTVDAAAAHADELQPGKIIFLTNRVVGRVLGIRKEGDGLVLVLGPVEIAELVRKADIHITGMPIDFGEALAYTAPNLPGQVTPVARNDQRPASARHAMFVPAIDTAPAPDVTNLVNFKTVPFASASGVGMRATTDAGGLKVKAEVLVHLATPTLDVHLRITPKGGVEEASVELKGAAGLTWKFDAGTDVGLRANVHGVLTPDTDFSIPVGGIGPVPIAVTVRQRFQINTALGVRNTTLSATGDYTFNGGFRVGYVNKTWGVAGPLGFKQAASFAQTGRGVSLGVSGINLGHSMKIIAGVGAFGFAAGPYFTFFSAVGLAKSSDIGMLACMSAPVVLKVNGGVGYVIPQAVTAAINSILRFFNVRYQLRGEGGLEPSETMTIINTESRTGGCRPPDKT
ncbi:MAG: hypothetical protein ABI885_08870 [Gammaproteobacteria bacterium]